MNERQEAPPTFAVLNGRPTIIDAACLADCYWAAVDLVLAVPCGPPREEQ